MNKKIIFFDVDGTLFDNDHLEIPKSAIAAIKELSKNEDYILALATGRTYKTINVIDEIKDLFRLKILINGQVIMYDEKIIYKNPMNVNNLEELKTYLLEKNIPQGFVGFENEAVTLINDYVQECFDRYCITLGDPDLDFIYKEDVYQSWVFGSNEEIDEMIEKFPCFAFFKWGEAGADIICQNQSKKTGIIKALEILDCKWENTIAIGDGNNDYEMLKYVNLSIAMGNASPLAKSVSSFITDDIKNDGIAKAIDYLLNKN